MPAKDRQLLITQMVSTVLGEPAQLKAKFNWFVNKHIDLHFSNHFSPISNIFNHLNGDLVANNTKRLLHLRPDAYFGGTYNFMFEFDEFQHFSSQRLETFIFYPDGLQTNFPIQHWKELCHKHKVEADKYRRSKDSTDFKFEGGRTAQRAYFDCFRDFLPSQNGLNPTLRISDLEVADIYTIDSDSLRKVERLLATRL